MKNLLALSLLFVLIVGCDPLQTLIIKTSGEENSSIIVYGNKEPFYGEVSQDDEKVIIQVPFLDSITKYEKMYSYGIGTWDSVSSEFLVKNIDSIIIKSDTGTLKLKEKDSLKNYLMNHRSGWAKSVITIGTK